MQSLQSYADTVSAQKRPRNSCSNCVFLAPQTSPESRIVWSLTAHRRRAPNSRPRADRENRAFWATHPCEPGLFAEFHIRIANCLELHRRAQPRAPAAHPCLMRRTIRFSSDPKSRNARIARPIIFSSTRISAMIRLSFANSRNFVYRLNKTMFFDNLPLEMTCSKCGKQINETVEWLKAKSRKCPFCNTLIDTTEFRRGIDEATNRTHEMLRNLQESLKSVKIKIKL
jgi:hypothetical protein